ncbi:hypothetical protein BGZ83_008980, partial [Gryganskiella cystojenkinii]
MDLTETRLQIASHLVLADICACARVCHSWNDYFSPLLYRVIDDNNVTSPITDKVTRHVVHAQTLKLRIDTPVIDQLLQLSATPEQQLLLSTPATTMTISTLSSSSVPTTTTSSSSFTAFRLTDLKEIELTGQFPEKRSYGRTIPLLVSKWSELFKRNPGLRRLAVRKLKTEVWSALVEACSPDELYIEDFEFHNGRGTVFPIPSFWKICENLSKLTLRFNNERTPRDTLPLPPSMKPLPRQGAHPGQPTQQQQQQTGSALPKMRQLDLGSSNSSVYDQMRLVQACGNLEMLAWNLSHTAFTTDRQSILRLFEHLFRPRTLPRLQELRIHQPATGGWGETVDLQTWLNFLPSPSPYPLPLLSSSSTSSSPSSSSPSSTMPAYSPARLTEFYVSLTYHVPAGGLVLRSLSRHYDSLCKLDLTRWAPHMVVNHVILCSCPNLQLFKTSALPAQNNSVQITSDPTFHFNPHHIYVGPDDPQLPARDTPWVCSRLSVLQARVNSAPTPEENRWLFERLCGFKELEDLCLE